MLTCCSFLDVCAPLYDLEDLSVLALYESSEFPIYQVSVSVNPYNPESSKRKNSRNMKTRSHRKKKKKRLHFKSLALLKQARLISGFIWMVIQYRIVTTYSNIHTTTWMKGFNLNGHALFATKSFRFIIKSIRCNQLFVLNSLKQFRMNYKR